MRNFLCVLAASAVVFLGGAASAAEVQTPYKFTVAIEGVGPVRLSGDTTVSQNGDTVSIAAGAITLATTVTVPVTGATAVNSLTATQISNQSGLFSPGGVTAQGPGEVCANPIPNNSACNSGGGVGGEMGLMGVLNVHVIPNAVVIPVNLNAARIGQGGTTTTPFIVDAALWSTGTGVVVTDEGSNTTKGGGSPFTLVSPTFVSAVGNNLPLFNSLELSNVSVPEPTGPLMLIAGLGALGVLGMRRRK